MNAPLLDGLLAIAIVALAFLMTGLIITDSPAERCEKRWSRSGMKAEHQRHVGCQVQLKDGTWVPESAVRR